MLARTLLVEVFTVYIRAYNNIWTMDNFHQVLYQYVATHKAMIATYIQFTLVLHS